MISIVARKMRTFLSQPPLFYVWLVPAWILLGFSRAAILMFSFKRIARWLGAHDGLAPRSPLSTPKDERRARGIGRAIKVAATYTPWESVCFPQSIVARIILGLYNIPYALFFGLMRDKKEAELKAHAWVVSGRINVTGGASFNQFTVVGCFVSDA